ncbi:hypothetical protein Rhe02_17400 [Rhizocola hellebori]|uniref:Glycolipid-binding domain-containing protein n=1 Tax=Rhizocola hellebori TaxID=1392758 RepID=A0A8J3VF87_9ACTN|nr:putative glycolipid-binding domain-containing protein [Rhizocola hellebori]GIH03673.1 hypothetical protein Rhe02_17400 [Rhizocola hellebori]
MAAVDRTKLISWRGVDADRWETARLDPSKEIGFLATGFQAGMDPEPYQLSYKLDVRRGFVHSHLVARVTGNGWHRELFLRRNESGAWTWRALSTGECQLPAPGAPQELAAELEGALDCDLGLAPLTNLMPVRRAKLHTDAGSCDILVVWVAVPELSLHAAPQRYEHLGRHDSGSTVRFSALDSGFTADLQLDPDGLVVAYPGLARRARSNQER